MGDKDFEFIQDKAGLTALTERVQAADRVALDTEADSLHHYFQKVCLIQLSLPDAHFIIDPLVDGLDLGGLMAALASTPLVLHGADYDLRMLRAAFGFRPAAALFDTMLAAQLLGHPRPGLAALVEEHFGVHLSKKGQKADWARRPLAPKLLAYAAHDTRYLLDLADALKADLRARGRLGWHTEWCACLVDATATDRERDPDDVWRIPGAGKLEPRALCLLRAAWHWREGEAQGIDRPPFRVLHNSDLLALVGWLAQGTKRRVRRHPDLGRRIKGRRLEALEDALALARSLPEADWPAKRRGRRQPSVGPLFKPLRQAATDKAKALGLDPSVLAPRAAIEAIARAKPAPEALAEAGSLMNWQAEVLEPVLRPILAGA